MLKQIHDDLDAAVFDAYGWPKDLTDEQILERLVALPPWPASLPERVSAVRALVSRSARPWSIDDVVAAFGKPERKTSKAVVLQQIEEVLDSLAALGLLVAYITPSGRRWQPPTRSVA